MSLDSECGALSSARIGLTQRLKILLSGVVVYDGWTRIEEA